MASETEMKPSNSKTPKAPGIPKATHLTTAEAAKVTGYTADHIGLLRRRGHLTGEKRGRDWFITAESLETYVKSNPKVGRPKS